LKFFKIFQKRAKNETIYIRPIRRFKMPISYKIKRFLKWLNLKDEFGYNLIDEDTSMQELIEHWNKSLFIWIFNIFLTGSLIYIAISPFYSTSFKLIPFTVFSFGLLYYVIMEAFKEIRSIWKKHG